MKQPMKFLIAFLLVVGLVLVTFITFNNLYLHENEAAPPRPPPSHSGSSGSTSGSKSTSEKTSGGSKSGSKMPGKTGSNGKESTSRY